MTDVLVVLAVVVTLAFVGMMGGAGFGLLILHKGSTRFKVWAEEIDALIEREKTER